MKPRSIGHLADLLALYRPGAWNEGIVDTYLRRHRGEEDYKLLLPVLEPILAPTYEAILYQEQVMAIAQAVTGCSMGKPTRSGAPYPRNQSKRCPDTRSGSFKERQHEAWRRSKHWPSSIFGAVFRVQLQ